ncbi:diaminobutyrate--2-oxoglutarate transaminase [Chitinophaga nivalis]|uniref:Diaminobutyrate--2-oxoglutarate transaminase n=1 Tax=Chitinophaga nivalis TaxID=2991709 RepID=A0ABT3IGV2_9BACT|nr:diaminobutyrate--2-oxoglutarate transaminase [Chitinophaga nivalis]MCW3467112.1 diaminobutyrate--2-oxoglutarate transaminase [Chitinophaga nivalis]MCW3483197.1 diaminobutyrate--2-oxoglutarate transaminase [Chitinophaga nivalis]
MLTQVFETMESNVRSYSRSFPAVFRKAKGTLLYADNGDAYIDFLMGAGALNYGHNNDFIKAQLLEYMAEDYIMQGLDMFTVAKSEFITTFNDLLLKPRGLNYKFQFCGPTGTNAIEAALKLARNYTRRSNVISFMGGYHGLSQGSLALTSNQYNRQVAGVGLHNVTFLPFENNAAGFDSLAYFEMILEDSHSGIEKPAAVILETVQAEGGINVASPEWLAALKGICEKHGILFIADDIQIGCGRSGNFFSFERAGIVPDIVVLSKSLSGYGLPMAMLLFKPELDIWQPGEHNGTFRGYQLAFIGGKAALEFREQTNLDAAVKEKSAYINRFLHEEIKGDDERISIRGLGMMWGIDLSAYDDVLLAKKIAQDCFKKQLIVECVGRHDRVIKLLPPLTVEQDVLDKALTIVRDTIQQHTGKKANLQTSVA